MVDSPEKLCTICLHKFVGLIKYDESLWKKQIERCVDQIYQEEKNQASLNDQRKRKYNRTDEDPIGQTIDFNAYETQLQSYNRSSYLEQFLRGICPLNAILSERLSNHLVRYNQLNDFTLTYFSSHVTYLKRVTLNVKYLSRLQCHILNQHSYLVELKILFKDSNVYRPNVLTSEIFYQKICPSINSKLEDIYTIYGPLILHHLYSQSQLDLARISLSNRYLFQRSPSLSEGFTHQKLFNTLLNSLHPLTYDRLKILNIAHYKFFAAYHSTLQRKHSLVDMSPLTKCSTNSPSIVTTSVNILPTNLRLILKFTNLTSLNLSNTDIKNHCLDILLDSFDKLDTLDISLCCLLTSFTALLKLSTKFKWLNLYNCSIHLQQNPTIYQILSQLEALEYLDISLDNNRSQLENEYDINRLLSKDNCLNSLKHLDLSGHGNMQSTALYDFLLRHPNLQFLGLFSTNEKYPKYLFDVNDPCHSKSRQYTLDSQEMISLITTEDDYLLYEPCLIESLKRYNERASFVQKILYQIFFFTRTFQSKHQNLFIKLILHTMSMHNNLQTVQMASTACIYNLTRTPLTEQINVKTLGEIVQAITNVMELFPNQQQLQKNCLLTLCSDRILHEPNFNFYLLASLVMNNLQNYADLAIIQPGVAVLALLTTRLTIAECTRLGSDTNLQRLIQLIEQQIDRLQTMHVNQQQDDLSVQESNNNLQLTGDDTLRFCLSLLWNLTDENPIVCEHFIHTMGLQLFQRLIYLFSSDTIILTKIVGLLSNISEVPHLRLYLYSIDIISLMQRFLTDGIIDIAFSATGILAHLLLEQINQEINRDLCQDMRNAIQKWKNPDTNMVTYRSFKPFIPLLHCTQIPVVQLWAIWAIHHVCSTDRARYSQIIREEKLYDLIQQIYHDSLSSDHSDTFTINLLNSILQLLKPYRSNEYR
ncbi:unnamed protein product [Adineta ricciae]|uniref:Protein zer-1 homolog-like C-terminal domain-containing protein n=1 Tax=Adineta ricciae TaxID=249248 RepID=A0A814TEU6_ADIRI|nr:unnamed protein product [Adineta ricciae]CAF1160786.1 unnamed protein product [Adineta ricciae]